MSQQIRLSLTDETYKLLKKHAKYNVRTISQEIEYQLKKIYKEMDTITPQNPQVTHAVTCEQPPYTLTTTVKTDDITVYYPTQTPQSEQVADTSPTPEPKPEELEPESLGTVTAQARIADENAEDYQDYAFTFYEKDGCVLYNVPPLMVMRWYEIDSMQQDIKDFLKEKLKMEYPYPPILSSSEKEICDYIHDNFPKNKTPDFVLEDIKCQHDTPDSLAYPQSHKLLKMLTNNMKVTHRMIGMECDYILEKYNEIYK